MKKPGRLAIWGLGIGLAAASAGCNTTYTREDFTLNQSGSDDAMALVQGTQTRDLTQLPNHISSLSEERRAELNETYAGLPSQTLNIYFVPQDSLESLVDGEGELVQLFPIEYDSTGSRNHLADIYNAFELVVPEDSSDSYLVQGSGISGTNVSPRAGKHTISFETMCVPCIT